MQTRAFLYFMAANILGGASYAATEPALRGFTPAGLVFFRLVLGALVLSPWLWRLLRRPIAREDWLRAAAVGCLGCAAPLWIGTVGQELSSSTNAALLIGVEPVSIVVLSALFLGERMTFARAAAIALGLSGAFLIVWQGAPLSGLFSGERVRGDLLLFLHGFLWALYSVIGKPALRRLGAMEFTALLTAFAVIPMAFLAWPWGAGVRAWPVEAAPFSALVFLSLGVGVLGVAAWNKALGLLPASKIAVFIFMQPLIGVALGVLVHRDPFTAWSAAGGALVVLGIYAAMKEEPDEDQSLRVRQVRDLPQGA